MPNSNNQNSGSGFKTAATLGIGAVIGALAAGAAWYMSAEDDERQAHQQRHTYSSAHPVHRAAPPASTGNATNDEKDEKDGTVKMCEVCFVSFDELKQCGVQIVSTPCGHVYCRDCIVGALSVNPVCPHCRREIHEGQLRRLFL